MNLRFHIKPDDAALPERDGFLGIGGARTHSPKISRLLRSGSFTHTARHVFTAGTEYTGEKGKPVMFDGHGRRG